MVSENLRASDQKKDTARYRHCLWRPGIQIPALIKLSP